MRGVSGCANTHGGARACAYLEEKECPHNVETHVGGVVHELRELGVDERECLVCELEEIEGVAEAPRLQQRLGLFVQRHALLEQLRVARRQVEAPPVLVAQLEEEAAVICVVASLCHGLDGLVHARHALRVPRRLLLLLLPLLLLGAAIHAAHHQHLGAIHDAALSQRLGLVLQHAACANARASACAPRRAPLARRPTFA